MKIDINELIKDYETNISGMKEKNDKMGMILNYNDLGDIYLSSDNISKAEIMYVHSLKTIFDINAKSSSYVDQFAL